MRYDIDHNIGRLSKDEAKFFLVNISLSEHELTFLKEEFGEEGARQQLKQYANKYYPDFSERDPSSRRDR